MIACVYWNFSAKRYIIILFTSDNSLLFLSLSVPWKCVKYQSSAPSSTKKFGNPCFIRFISNWLVTCTFKPSTLWFFEIRVSRTNVKTQQIYFQANLTYRIRLTNRRVIHLRKRSKWTKWSRRESVRLKKPLTGAYH